MNKNDSRIAYLFRRYFDKTASESEGVELFEWVGKDKNVDRLKELMDQAWEASEERETIFSAKKSEEILHHILQDGISSPNFSGTTHYKRRFPLWRKVAAAAAVLLLLAVGGYLLKENTPKENLITVAPQIKNDVAPGGNKAILTLGNGNKISLGDTHKGLLSLQGQTKVIKVNSGQLAYRRQEAVGNREQQTTDNGQQTTDNRQQTKIQYNTVTTPRGGQYEIELPDGSKVWLNAASSIRFPTAFTGTQRQVNITGEAYFEIAKNAEIPFVVETGKMKVRVLGTRFNLNAYKDELSMRTTLVSGVVKIETGDKDKVLRPGQQAEVGWHSTSIQVKKAKLEEAIAWKNGMFYFDEDRIAQIMRRLSRWYDVKVTYEGSVPSGHYTGVISRNTNLSEVLKVLAMSGIRFKIEGKEIFVLS